MNCRMDTVRGKMTAAMKANLSKNRFSQFAYKPDKKKIVPFGLEASAAPVLGEILTRMPRSWNPSQG
jgi:hypothetical protein